MKIIKYLIIIALCGISHAEAIKNGFYKSLGAGIGYYNYTEYVDNSRLISMDDVAIKLLGNLGYVYDNGFKLDSTLSASASYGLYRGSKLYDDTKEFGSVKALVINFYMDFEGKVGFNILKPFGIDSVTLYMQSGIGYYFNKTDSFPIIRNQGYLYIPIELDSEISLSDKFALRIVAGYNYFILGNHYTSTTHVALSDDYYVIQRRGYGVSLFVGLNMTNSSGNISSLGIRWNHWWVGRADPSGILTNLITNDRHIVFEPENSSDIIMLEYSIGF